jgi:hypothetical protein
MQEWTLAAKMEECSWLMDAIRIQGYCWPNLGRHIDAATKSLSLLSNEAKLEQARHQQQQLQQQQLRSQQAQQYQHEQRIQQQQQFHQTQLHSEQYHSPNNLISAFAPCTLMIFCRLHLFAH